MKQLFWILEIFFTLACFLSDDFWASFWAANIIGIIPVMIIAFAINKTKSTLKNNKNPIVKKSEKDIKLLKLLYKCKQSGTLKDIENLKSSIETNIKNNGSGAEFFDLNFIIAKIYNYMDDKDNTNDSFEKVLNIIKKFDYSELCKIVDKYLEKERFQDAVCLYTYILEGKKCNTLNNIQSVPDIYYKRAIAYLGLKQYYYKNLAIEDLNTAKEKAEYVYEMFDNIPENYLTEKLEKYNLKLDEITGKQENITIDSPYLIKEDEILESKTENEKTTIETEENKTIEEPVNYGLQAYEKACKLMNKKDYESAIESFLTAFQYNVNTVEALRNLANAEKCLGNFQSAISYYKDVLKEEPNDAIAYNNIGNIYFQMKKYDEAFNAYNKAIEIDNNFDIAITNREKIVKMREKEQQKKADLLYKQARNDFNYKDYNKAKENIIFAIQLYSAQKYKTLELRINKCLENIESLYNNAILLINTGTTVKNYQTALKMLKKVIVLNPNGEQEYSLELEKVNNYIKIQKLVDLGFLSEAKQLIQKLQKVLNDKKLETFSAHIENMQKQAEDLYNKTQKYIEENNLKKAKNCIQSALKIDKCNKYKKLSDKIIVEFNADKYYRSYLKNLDKKHYIEALSLINKALEIIPKKAISNNALKEITPIVANMYFQDGQNFLEQQNYEKAIELFNNAITLDSANLSYSTAFNTAVEENNKRQANAFYQNSLNNMKNGNFELAISNIQKALDIYPDSEKYQNVMEKANNRMVDITTCNKGAILTLDGFDEEKTEQFLQDRKIMKWYDIESFAKYFNLEPHEQILISDRLIFPLKPHIKQGRTIDI